MKLELDSHPGGADVPNWAIGLFIAVFGLVLLVVVSLTAPGAYGTNRDGRGGVGGGPVATPSPYGPPDAESRTRAWRSLPVLPSIS